MLAILWLSMATSYPRYCALSYPFQGQAGVDLATDIVLLAKLDMREVSAIPDSFLHLETADGKNVALGDISTNNTNGHVRVEITDLLEPDTDYVLHVDYEELWDAHYQPDFVFQSRYKVAFSTKNDLAYLGRIWRSGAETLVFSLPVTSDSSDLFNIPPPAEADARATTEVVQSQGRTPYEIELKNENLTDGRDLIGSITVWAAGDVSLVVQIPNEVDSDDEDRDYSLAPVLPTSLHQITTLTHEDICYGDGQ